MQEKNALTHNLKNTVICRTFVLHFDQEHLKAIIVLCLWFQTNFEKESAQECKTAEMLIQKYLD